MFFIIIPAGFLLSYFVLEINSDSYNDTDCSCISNKLSHPEVMRVAQMKKNRHSKS